MCAVLALQRFCLALWIEERTKHIMCWPCFAGLLSRFIALAYMFRLVAFSVPVSHSTRIRARETQGFKVFRYSFWETIPMLFNHLKSDFILVRSLQNFHQ